MKPVYQTLIDPHKGDCMQAVFASLFEVELNDVPKFIELGDMWFSTMIDFARSMGYKREGTLWNRKHQILSNPNYYCFNKVRFDQETTLNKKNLSKYEGVNGFFYAGVLSPKFFNLSDGFNYQHAVIVDKDLNIVHDPNPNYKGILKYPLADLLGCNGIVDVYLFEKK